MVSNEAAINMSARAVVSSDGSIGFQAYIFVGRIQFLESCWIENLSYLLVVDWQLSQFFVMLASTFASSEKAPKKSQRQGTGKRVPVRQKSQSVIT